jgi:hypothetical protein
VAHVRITGNRSDTKIVTVDVPIDATPEQTRDQLFSLTGGNGDTVVGVEITRFDARPDLVGYTYEWEDN